MKQGKCSTFPVLRRAYGSLDELAAVICKNRVTACRKLQNGNFTNKEKEAIAEDLVKRGAATNRNQAIEIISGV